LFTGKVQFDGIPFAVGKQPGEGTMFNTAVLEVAIGFVFCFASVALITSTIQEGISSALKLRSRTLFSGVKDILNDQSFAGLARAVYNNALINARSSGVATNATELDVKPSYIPPRHFAQALVEAIQQRGQEGEEGAKDLQAAIGRIEDPQLKSLFQGMYDRAAGDVTKLHGDVAAWFDASMERVSGAYKRQTQLMCFIVAFVIAMIFNVDSIALFKTLWQHPASAAQMSATNPGDISQAVEGMQKLPVGWADPNNEVVGWVRTGIAPADATSARKFAIELALMVLGWTITATSALFGAPFWFDWLQTLVQLRGTGAKPGEKAKKQDD
jgi:hypothetical protein